VLPRPTLDQLTAALATVDDPEIRKPITELGMVSDLAIDDDNVASVTILLTVSSCPLKDTLTRDVASGKGGVGKSSITANLAAALAAEGLKVGVVDADVYGFSIPRMLGVERQPTQVDDLLMPPEAHGVKVISVGMFVPNNTPVVWRGPMLHRALQQFLSDVYFGDLDVLLLDLPPGTGDVAISVAQLIPGSEIIVVTTPQQAAAEVAERAGSISVQTHQRLVGVIENMSWLELPDGSRQEIFGTGGGQAVADSLTRASFRGSLRASRTILRGSYRRGSYCRQLMSSNSGPICSLSWALAPSAMIRKLRMPRASFAAYSGIRWGPMITMISTKTTTHSLQSISMAGGSSSRRSTFSGTQSFSVFWRFRVLRFSGASLVGFSRSWQLARSL
jgi:ATP-binding protein involved in chromosome partitioning